MIGDSATKTCVADMVDMKLCRPMKYFTATREERIISEVIYDD